MFSNVRTRSGRFPLAYHARKHHQCLDKMTERQKKSLAYQVRCVPEPGQAMMRTR